MAPDHPASARTNFENLDLMRFLAASFVVVGHISRFFPVASIHDYGIAKKHYLFHSITQLVFNGTAAVMLFFIVSGICINAPYRSRRPLHLFEFYSRRYIRIGIPLIIAYVISIIVSGAFDFTALAVVWSLWCEAIYYLLYPGIVFLADRVGFGVIFALSTAIAVLFSLVPDGPRDHAWAYGPFLTWIVFFPIWLSGMWISENTYRTKPLPVLIKSKGAAALGGLCLVMLATMTTVLQFHTDGAFNRPLYVMWGFSVAGAIFVLLFVSIDLSANKIIRILEHQGRWSYSLYLIHFPVLFLLTQIMIAAGIDRLHQTGLIIVSAGCFVLALTAAIIFYQFVERPAHLFAKHFASKVRLMPSPIIERTAR